MLETACDVYLEMLPETFDDAVALLGTEARKAGPNGEAIPEAPTDET